MYALFTNAAKAEGDEMLIQGWPKVSETIMGGGRHLCQLYRLIALISDRRIAIIESLSFNMIISLTIVMDVDIP